MIRKLILAALACLALASAAYARSPETPKEMRGVWCSPADGTQGEYLDGPCTDDRLGLEIKVTANGYTHEEGQCSVISIASFNYYRKGILNPWGPGYRVKLRCNNDGHRVVEEQEWRLAKGYFVIRDWRACAVCRQ
jgi:hypothetical protein